MNKYSDPMPTPAQQAWMDMKYGMFIHFGPNTVQHTGWGDGTFPAQEVVFPELDPRQWAETAAKAGMRYAVLTAKHHDGFCLWPTQTTEYCVRNTPQKRDIAGEFAAAFRQAGLQVGFYYSLWDRNCPFYEDDAAYAEYMRQQIAELCQAYGPLVELWFDGAWDKDHPTRQWPYDPAWETDPHSGLSHGERFEWQTLYALIHRLQPGCLVFNNSSSDRPGRIKYFPVDGRTCEQFDFIYQDRFIEVELNPVSVDHTGKQVFLPLECETTLMPDWFWTGRDFFHPSPATIADWRRRANNAGGNLLLNAGPDARGLIPDYSREILAEAAHL